MQLLSILGCFSMLLQVSLSTPLLASKPKPVDLAYTCMAALDPDSKDQTRDDVPVILIHGMTERRETWNGVYEVIALATKKKVCMVDLRNHGESPWNDEEYDVAAMTEDIKHFIEQINAPKAIVCGHSLGGKVALHLALTYPEIVEKVIVEDMRPNGIPEESMKGSADYTRLLIELGKILPQGVTETEAKEQFVSMMKEHLAKVNVSFNIQDITLVPVKCSDGKCQLSINPALLEAMLRNRYEVMTESSGRFDGPALFIYGAEATNRVGDDESNIKKLFPNAQLVGVEGAGHKVHSHKQFTREVIKFINSN